MKKLIILGLSIMVCLIVLSSSCGNYSSTESSSTEDCAEHGHPDPIVNGSVTSRDVDMEGDKATIILTEVQGTIYKALYDKGCSFYLRCENPENGDESLMVQCKGETIITKCSFQYVGRCNLTAYISKNETTGFRPITLIRQPTSSSHF